MSTAVPASTVKRVLFISGSKGSGTLRYRVRLAEEALRSRGIRTAAIHFSEPALRSWAQDADVVVLYRVPLTAAVLSLIRWTRDRGIAVTFDVDDRVFNSEHGAELPFLDRLGPRQRELFLQDLPRRAATASLVDRGSGATEGIVSDLEGLVPGPVDHLPNGVGQVALVSADATMARRLRALRHTTRMRLGYFSGSATHDRDWALIEDDVVAVMQADPRIDLWLVGPLAVSAALEPVADRVRVITTVPWQDLFELLAQVDVNLAPLAPSSFTEAKSAIKWLEAALVATPTIATSTGPFRHAVVDDRDALLVAAGTSWLPALTRLTSDAALRAEFGGEARRGALLRFGPEIQANRYQQFVQAAQDGPRVELTEVALAAAELAAPRLVTVGASLEDYPFQNPVVDLELEPPRWSGSLSASRDGARYAVVRSRQIARGAARRARDLSARRSHG